MELAPILIALRRHKAGALLIGMQIALTLAIICNALLLIHQRVAHLSRPTGLIETNLLTVQNEWVDAHGEATVPLIRRDLLTLRGLPGVQEATVMNAFPLVGGGSSTMVGFDPSFHHWIAQTAVYATDAHALATLGVKLVAGRNFRPEEVGASTLTSLTSPPVVIITRALADKLFANGAALGKAIDLGIGAHPHASTVIGILKRLTGPWPYANFDPWANYTVLIPVQLAGASNYYLVRARPGQLATLAQAVPQALFKVDRLRVIPVRGGIGDAAGIRTFAQVRAGAYKSDRGTAIIMGLICVVALGTTAAGIVGLTSFWVDQRRRHIGIRRALGATRADILGYFLAENLLIGTAGAAVGVALGMGLNLWLTSHFQSERLSLSSLLLAVLVVLLLGQAATLSPALRASRVPPIEACRPV